MDDGTIAIIVVGVIIFLIVFYYFLETIGFPIKRILSGIYNLVSTPINGLFGASAWLLEKTNQVLGGISNFFTGKQKKEGKIRDETVRGLQAVAEAESEAQLIENDEEWDESLGNQKKSEEILYEENQQNLENLIKSSDVLKKAEDELENARAVVAEAEAEGTQAKVQKAEAKVQKAEAKVQEAEAKDDELNKYVTAQMLELKKNNLEAQGKTVTDFKLTLAELKRLRDVSAKKHAIKKARELEKARQRKKSSIAKAIRGLGRKFSPKREEGKQQGIRDRITKSAEEYFEGENLDYEANRLDIAKSVKGMRLETQPPLGQSPGLNLTTPSPIPIKNHRRKTATNPTPRRRKTATNPTPRRRKTATNPTPRRRKTATNPTPRRRKTATNPTPRRRKTATNPTPRRRKTATNPTPRRRRA